MKKLFIIILFLAGCSSIQSPYGPVSSEYSFLEKWGKDYYTRGGLIGPGHGDGTSGSEVGAFHSPSSIILNGTAVLVLDQENHRIQQFSTTGTPLAFTDPSAPGVEGNILGSEGNDENEFMLPSGIASDSSGNIFVSDERNFNVQIFSSSGAFQQRLTRLVGSDPAPTNAPGGFLSPKALCTDLSNRLYVLDPMKSSIDRYTNSASVWSPDLSWGTGGSLVNSLFQSGQDLQSSGSDLYLLLPYSLLKISSSGAVADSLGEFGFMEHQFSSAKALNINSEYFIITEGSHIKIFDRFMNYLFFLGGQSGERDGLFSDPGGTVSAGNLLFIADQGNNRIQVFEAEE